MFDFSMGKLLLLALIALLVLGPEKLPGAARTVGTMIRRVRRGWDSVREEMERELEIEEMRQLARKAAADAEAAQNEASDTLRKMKEEMARVQAETEAMAKEKKADLEAAMSDDMDTPADTAIAASDDTDDTSAVTEPGDSDELHDGKHQA